MSGAYVVPHCINVSFTTRVDRTARVLEIAEAFGLGLDDQTFEIYKDFEFETVKGDRIYITGQSGSGKSIILRELRADYEKAGLSVASIDDVSFDEDLSLIDQIGNSVNEACGILSRAGLNDANLFIKKPSQLSDGQKYRLRLAKLIESDAQVWLCDEFGAVLDRVTAKVIANAIHKLSVQKGVTVAIATTHRDLRADFGATKTIVKNYAKDVAFQVTPPAELEIY